MNKKTPFFVENFPQGAIGVLRDHLEALADESTYKEVQPDNETYISDLREGEEQFYDIYVEDISNLIVDLLSKVQIENLSPLVLNNVFEE